MMRLSPAVLPSVPSWPELLLSQLLPTPPMTSPRTRMLTGSSVSEVSVSPTSLEEDTTASAPAPSRSPSSLLSVEPPSSPAGDFPMRRSTTSAPSLTRSSRSPSSPRRDTRPPTPLESTRASEDPLESSLVLSKQVGAREGRGAWLTVWAVLKQYSRYREMVIHVSAFNKLEDGIILRCHAGTSERKRPSCESRRPVPVLYHILLLLYHSRHEAENDDPPVPVHAHVALRAVR
mmetsp:Transcript_20531/g.68797  ORF Transcript_20531/g.68797 Transcript_20531/m.68797 type:complete len:233 (+) Transcript_20531:82-780(+)